MVQMQVAASGFFCLCSLPPVSLWDRPLLSRVRRAPRSRWTQPTATARTTTPGSTRAMSARVTTAAARALAPTPGSTSVAESPCSSRVLREITRLRAGASVPALCRCLLLSGGCAERLAHAVLEDERRAAARAHGDVAPPRELQAVCRGLQVQPLQDGPYDDLHLERGEA